MNALHVSLRPGAIRAHPLSILRSGDLQVWTYKSLLGSPSLSLVRCRADGDGGPQTQTPDEPQVPTPAPAPQKKIEKQEDLTRGQRTAIVTGAVSIIFGIAYLALVQFMDMRGGELLPPPPEAYLP